MLELRTLGAGDEGLVEAFLIGHRDTSMFLRSNSRQAGLVYTGQRLGGTYVGGFDGGRLIGIVAHSWNGILLLQAPAAVSEIVRGAFQSTYLGYMGFLPHAGQGYMTEGMALALDVAFRKLRLHRVEVNIQPSNARSLALAKRIGFTREGFSRRYVKIAGRWRDHERYAMLAEDWAKLRKRVVGRVASRDASGKH